MARAQTLPALDEATFQQMLEAAYVLQARNRPQAVRRRPELAETLAEIAATQEVLHSKDWDLKTSAQLIAEQLQKITGATGVAVAILHDDQLEYSAAVGTAASLTGMTMAIDSSLSEFLQTAATDPALIGGLLKRRDSKSPFLFPVYHEGTVSGLLDVRFGDCDAISEQEVQSCQVMAGLMGQAIASVAKSEWKHALAAERATMLEVLERLRPQLERLAEEAEETSLEARTELDDEPGTPNRERTSPEIEALLTAMSQAAEKTGAGAACGQCGYQFGERELFCGRCGTPRLMSSQPEEFDFSGTEPFPQGVQPEEPVAKGGSEAGPHLVTEAPMPPTFETSLPQSSGETARVDGSSALAVNPDAAEIATPGSEVPEGIPVEVQKPGAAASQPSPTESIAPATWTSAARALPWLKSLEKANSPARIWLAKHRGDVSIALSSMLLLLALTGFGLHPGSDAGHRARLTLFERILVDLGLAEAPPQPVATGNPNVWVWVDVHTALYYCPGSDLYGKTPGGKFVLQHEAQIDQFQPAERASCQ